MWGKTNNPQQWWSPNGYKILSATFRHEVGAFLRVYSSYLPKEESKPEPATPQKSVNLQPTISGLLTPKKPRNVTFPEAPPISSITSSIRLGAMMGNTSSTPKVSSKEQYPPWKGWDVSRTVLKDIFNKPESSEEIVSTIRRPRGSPTPPSNSSDSGERSPKENEGPLKLPPQSYKQPSAVPTKYKEEANPKTYHFDMKLKPETVPTWDGNENTLARWMEKVGQLANISPDIFKKLGKIVPRRLTHSMETWYYSISSKDRQLMEQNWGTLKTAIADYWMNHSWLEVQKFRANTTRYREAGYTHETPSEYVSRKMDLIRLVYDYTDSQIIRLITKEALDSWSSLLQLKFRKTVVQTQNAVKYHESTLLAMTPQKTNPATQFPNKNFQTQ